MPNVITLKINVSELTFTNKKSIKEIISLPYNLTVKNGILSYIGE